MTTSWTPWHRVVTLREDLKSGELSLAQFAADLYDVSMGTARPIYQRTDEFFALTYPTYAIRELASDVVHRLEGKTDRAIRQLELTYGGGKTHTLIALYHLTRDPEDLPDLPSVQEFKQHIGMTPPRARVVVLAFDKLDVEKGMEVLAPDGSRRWLKHPWSVLAYQIAGDDGLRLLHADSAAEERESAPAENLLSSLLAIPAQEGLATLILMDEVLMYAREKVAMDARWETSLENFFQYLSQAAAKTDRCAIVASLLATDPKKSDTVGKRILSKLSGVLRRQREESVEPVSKEDVAEVLRRRFFTAESIQNPGTFRSHVVAAIQGIQGLDPSSQKDPKGTEERFLQSYPFHPDLTEVFYSKWTGLEGFQRTRGMLRTFALALRDAAQWDDSPLVGVNIFLGAPESRALSEGARELTNIAAAEEYEGKRQEWNAILLGELEKARDIQAEFSGIDHREMERAVFATFLHSQPIGKSALLRDLMLLVGDTRPDRIEFEKALLLWTQRSWFLDEASLQEAGADGELPKTWRLGSRPNLTQMHHEACGRISTEVIDATLEEQIRALKSLSAGAQALGVRVHNLPNHPRDIEDDAAFHYAILKPNAAASPGRPSEETKRFIQETTSADKPRVYRNALVLAVPSIDGIDAARSRVLESLGWEEVRYQLSKQDVDPSRMEMLTISQKKAQSRIPEAIKQAYSIVVAVDEKNTVDAVKVAVSEEPLFTTIKNTRQLRIQDTAITPEALLPDGPYNLWRDGETSRRANTLVTAFAQFPHLPKMLNTKAVYDTLRQGCENGSFVLRIERPDRSYRTFWKHVPSDAPLDDPKLEVVLPEAAELTRLHADLLLPGNLPGLWEQDGFTFGALKQYFSGKHVVQVSRDGYEEPLAIPKASRAVLEEAVKYAVERGMLWLTSGPSSIFREAIPAGILNDNARLQSPPEDIDIFRVVPDALPEAWSQPTTSALAIANAVSAKADKNLPWSVIQEAIEGAIRARYLEILPGSADWPCQYASAGQIQLRVPEDAPKPESRAKGKLVARAELGVKEIQDLAEKIGEITQAAVGHDIKFTLQIDLGGEERPQQDVIAKINELLQHVTAKLELK